jgi:small GTP-binding protein
MIQTENRQETVQSLKGKLLTSYKYLIEHQDDENAGKVKQLAEKLANEEFTIAFCGHFSAGKSTMINRLVGENLLPSSPIPTSANLVKVKSGEEYAKVFFKNEKPRLYLAPYDYSLVKNYCKDGDQIQEIEISHSDSNLPNKTVIMDTPGIDSADDAHRIATESAIHLADLIFYVMDYNHVQSELNFIFTKELTEAGKEVYLVINQIDKHSDEELTFTEFKKSVVDSFSSWGVKPADIFYTSLKKKDHQFNQFNQLHLFLEERLKERDQLLLQSIFHSLQKVLKDHYDVKKKTNEQEIAPFRDILNELSIEEQANLAKNYHELSEAVEALGDGVEKEEIKFDSEVNQIMNNAYLMPFQTRELAESFLESCQPDFKVGFLFTKQKTLDARKERLNLFYQDILEKTKTQVEWHLREFLFKLLKDKRIENQELLANAQSLSVQFSRELLESAVKTGARLSGDYVLNYTEDVANEIKRTAKNAILVLKTNIIDAIKAKNAAIQEKLTTQSKSLERYIKAYEVIKNYEADQVQQQSSIEKLFSQTSLLVENDPFNLFKPAEEEFEVVYGEEIKIVKKEEKQPILPANNYHQKEEKVSTDPTERMKVIAGQLKKTAKLVHGLPGFNKISQELIEKAERLDQKGFTVALFGAFSAGKSSFANALIGEKVLPVSPNPTTAAINKIKPVNDSYRHGTVLVKLKEDRAMLDDINRALKIFDLKAENFNDALKNIEKINGQAGQEGVVEKTNYTFLQAFKRGYQAFSNQLGQIIETTIAEFSDFVAKEEKSCFVEWIDLYYDCELTRKGITLVDTPGADSINARHTNVAFDFIKNSDAILFVTYYNHAFSKADREFLIQLGRVKDAFQLDKMFFIINAIDLSDSEEEKNTVVEYVHDQLIKYGVRNPHLYPLSSLNALKEKQEQADTPSSGMEQFENAFYHFISNDLANMAMASSENELHRVSQLVSKLIDSAKEDAAVKLHKREHIEAEKERIQAIVRQQRAENLQKRLSQETEELVYYIKQRVFFRFGDFFKEAFNPSVLRDDGRNLKKALQDSLSEFLEELGYDFAQEMRATTVRLDRFTEKIIAQYQEALVDELQHVNQDLSFSIFEFTNQQEIQFETAFKGINSGLFSKAMSYFKNPKSFFEKNEKKLMSDELNRVLNNPADEYLKTEKLRVIELYNTVIEGVFAQLISQIIEEADDFYLGLLSALDGGVPTEKLMEIQQELSKL